MREITGTISLASAEDGDPSDADFFRGSWSQGGRKGEEKVAEGNSVLLGTVIGRKGRSRTQATRGPSVPRFIAERAATLPTPAHGKPLRSAASHRGELGLGAGWGSKGAACFARFSASIIGAGGFSGSLSLALGPRQWHASPSVLGATLISFFPSSRHGRRWDYAQGEFWRWAPHQ
jgi:hypothetical protein